MHNHLLKIIFWNASGILHNFNELQVLTTKYKIGIMFIEETQLHPHKPLKIRNYHIYKSDNVLQSGVQSHDGTTILVHCRILYKYTVINTITSSTTISNIHRQLFHPGDISVQKSQSITICERFWQKT